MDNHVNTQHCIEKLFLKVTCIQKIKQLKHSYHLFHDIFSALLVKNKQTKLSAYNRESAVQHFVLLFTSIQTKQSGIAGFVSWRISPIDKISESFELQFCGFSSSLFFQLYELGLNFWKVSKSAMLWFMLHVILREKIYCKFAYLDVWKKCFQTLSDKGYGQLDCTFPVRYCQIHSP